MKAGRLILIIIGSLIGLFGLGALSAGGVLLWAHETQRDASGYFRTSTERLATPTYGFTSREVDLGSDPGGHVWFVGDDLATVRLRAVRADGGPVFVGIGRSSDVEQYLANVSHAEISDASFHNGNLRDADVTTVPVPGTAMPEPPSEQSFWVASASGTGTRSVAWKVASGAYSAVVMNADGSRPVAVDASVGVKLNWLLALAVGLLIGGVVVLAVGVALIVLGAVAGHREPADGEGVAAVPGAVAGDQGQPAAYPVRLDGRLEPGLSRWLWLVKAILLIPHFLILVFLWFAFGVVTFVAFFAILFTGRYPRAMFDFNVGVLRWSWRVAFYSFSALGTDRYPPFSMADDPSYPARLAVDYPARLSRGLVLVKWWLLAIPQYVIVAVFEGGWWGVRRGPGPDNYAFGAPVGGGLIGILVVIAGIALLFTAAYPAGLFSFVMGLNRWVVRVAAYATLLRDEYPPFRLDAGGDDPGTVTAGTPVPAPDADDWPSPPPAAS